VLSLHLTGAGSQVAQQRTLFSSWAGSSEAGAVLSLHLARAGSQVAQQRTLRQIVSSWAGSSEAGPELSLHLAGAGSQVAHQRILGQRSLAGQVALRLARYSHSTWQELAAR
jgi:hypothetical protein